MRCAALAAAVIACAGVHGCADEALDDGQETAEEIGENLIVGLGQGVSHGHAVSAAEAEQFTLALREAPQLRREPAVALADIRSLEGRARVEAIQDYIAAAHELPEEGRGAALMQLAALWKRAPELSWDIPDTLSGRTLPQPAAPKALSPSHSPSLSSAITSCNIDFAQSSALAALPFEQAYGFASPPWYQHHCDDLNWTFKVDDAGGAVAGHLHIWSDNPAVNCVTTSAAWPNGVMGIDNGSGTCWPVNPLTESREVATHGSAYWVRITRVGTSIGGYRAARITVRGTAELRVKIDNADGTWWEYTHLTPGTWTLLPNGHSAKTIWVMDQNQKSGVPPHFDDFVIVGPL